MIRALNPPGKLAFFRRTNLCSPVAAYVVKRAYRPALFSSHDHALAYDMCQKILPGLLDLLASPHAHPHPEIESLHLLAKESRVRIILPLQCLHLHRLTFRYRRPACLAQVPSQNRQAMPRYSKNSLISPSRSDRQLTLFFSSAPRCVACHLPHLTRSSGIKAFLLHADAINEWGRAPRRNRASRLS